MSITARLPQVPRQTESGELDVFEAAGYFSGANELYATNSIPPNKMMRSSGRMSLDIPMMRSSFPAPNHQQKVIKDDRKNNKQPNSPGGKLASFLSSLFNQTSKKKKSKISSTKDDQDHEVGRRKRRSSISHFQSVNTTFSDHSKSSSFYSSSNSQLKTPPPCPNTLTKSCAIEDFESHISVQNPVNHAGSPSSYREVYNIDNSNESTWLNEEKFEFGINSNEFSLEKYNTFANGVLRDQIIDHSDERRNFKNLIKDADEGAESDSSSDLFELQINYDVVSCYSSDLPVYETTNMDSINRGAPI